MSRKASATLIGGFIIGALVLATIAVIVFGGQGFFRKKEQVIMYFSESVYGLNEGAPVNIRGVQIGTVKKINIIFNTENGDFRVPVLVDANPGSIAKARELDIGANEDPIKILIENLGLRGQLQIQSLLTSQLYIELDYHPDTEINYYGDGSILEIPTIPSQIARFSKVLDEISIDVVVQELVDSIHAIKGFVTSEEIAHSMTSLQELLDTLQGASSDVGGLARQLREQTTVFSDKSSRTMTEIDRLTRSMNKSFNKLNRLLDEDSPELQKINNMLDEVSQAAGVISEFKDAPERYRLEKALKELELAARSFRQLSETIEKNPRALLWGNATEASQP